MIKCLKPWGTIVDTITIVYYLAENANEKVNNDTQKNTNLWAEQSKKPLSCLSSSHSLSYFGNFIDPL